MNAKRLSLLSVAFLILVGTNSVQAEPNDHGGGGGREKRQRTPVARSRSTQHVEVSKRNVEVSRTRVTVMRTNVHVVNIVHERVGILAPPAFRASVNVRIGVFGGFYSRPEYRFWYRPWYRAGFYGGFYFPVHPYPIWDLYDHPMVLWMYDAHISEVNAEYFTTWYGRPVAIEPFRYAGVYVPTKEMADVGVEVSGMDFEKQEKFRKALSLVTEQLAATAPGHVLEQNDVVVTFQENLQNDAIVMAGFIDRGGQQINFQALLDLEHPRKSIVAVPQGQDPEKDKATMDKLDDMNDRIEELGGQPFDQAPPQP